MGRGERWQEESEWSERIASEEVLKVEKQKIQTQTTQYKQTKGSTVPEPNLRAGAGSAGATTAPKAPHTTRAESHKPRKHTRTPRCG